MHVLLVSRVLPCFLSPHARGTRTRLSYLIESARSRQAQCSRCTPTRLATDPSHCPSASGGDLWLRSSSRIPLAPSSALRLASPIGSQRHTGVSRRGVPPSTHLGDGPSCKDCLPARTSALALAGSDPGQRLFHRRVCCGMLAPLCASPSSLAELSQLFNSDSLVSRWSTGEITRCSERACDPYTLLCQAPSANLQTAMIRVRLAHASCFGEPKQRGIGEPER